MEINRLIRKSFHIEADPEQGISMLSDWLANEIEKHYTILFQSDFNFMNRRTPFCMMLINRPDGLIEISGVRMDYQIFVDRKTERNLITKKDSIIMLDEWETFEELRGEKNCKHDPFALYLEKIQQAHVSSFSARRYQVGVAACIDSWLCDEYIIPEEYDYDEGEPHTIGGFIVIETDKDKDKRVLKLKEGESISKRPPLPDEFLKLKGKIANDKLLSTD